MKRWQDSSPLVSRSPWASLGFALLVGALVGCESTAEDAQGLACGGYPEAPAGATTLVYASATCGAAGADGTSSRPYATLSEALEKAPDGATILAAPGTYAENLTIARAVAIIGSSTTKAEAAGIILQAPAPYAVVAKDGADVTLQGVAVESPVGAGLWSHGAKLTATGCRITGAVADDAGQFGYGVLASDDGEIILQSSAVTGSQSTGVLISGAHGIILQDEIADNAGGGVRIEVATDEVHVEGSTVTNNAGVGVGILSSKAIILQSEVSGTKAGGAVGSADGILVAELKDEAGNGMGAADGTIDTCQVLGSGRVGVLFTGDTKGIILQSTIKDSGLDAPFGAGVWMQAGAGAAAPVEVQGSTLSGNKYLGIGMTGGARGIILQNEAITGTLAGPVFSGVSSDPIGDGVGLYDGASAQIEGNSLTKNERFGVMMDAPDVGWTCTGNTISDNGEGGIILQDTADGLPAGVSQDNTFSGNGAGDTQSVAAGTFNFMAEELGTN